MKNFNSNQFSIFNFYSMSSGSKVIVDLVFELAWAEVCMGNICIKGIKNGWITNISRWIIDVCLSDTMVHFIQ